MPSPAKKLFISYSRGDGWVVKKLTQILRVSGADVWRDEDSIKPGNRWETELSLNLDESECVLVFWSSGAARSDWVKKEYFRAIELAKDLVPVLLDKTPLSGELKNYQWIDCREYRLTKRKGGSVYRGILLVTALVLTAFVAGLAAGIRFHDVVGPSSNIGDVLSPKNFEVYPRNVGGEFTEARTKSPSEAVTPPPDKADPKVRTVEIEEATSFTAFAYRYGTTTEQLNALNGLNLKEDTMLAKGSELYVPNNSANTSVAGSYFPPPIIPPPIDPSIPNLNALETMDEDEVPPFPELPDYSPDESYNPDDGLANFIEDSGLAIAVAEAELAAVRAVAEARRAHLRDIFDQREDWLTKQEQALARAREERERAEEEMKMKSVAAESSSNEEPVTQTPAQETADEERPGFFDQLPYKPVFWTSASLLIILPFWLAGRTIKKRRRVDAAIAESFRRRLSAPAG